ncbi:MAG: hypothetical protein ACI4M9_08625 [Succinivibrio sp.]
MKTVNTISLALLGSAFVSLFFPAFADSSETEDMYGNSTYGYGSQLQEGVDDFTEDEKDKINRLARAQNFKEKKMLEMQQRINQRDFSTIAGQQILAQKYIEQEKAAGRYDEKAKKTAEHVIKESQRRLKENQKVTIATQQTLKNYLEHEDEHIKSYQDDFKKLVTNDKKKKEDQGFFYSNGE